MFQAYIVSLISKALAMNLTLTQPNAAALERYADLAGVSPEEFLNRFLEEFLVARFSDPDCGDAEPFLLNFTFRDAMTAQRLAAWVTERLTVPGSRDTLEVEIFELPRGGFRVQAAWIGDGTMYKL
jgi:hypothetical protein